MVHFGGRRNFYDTRILTVSVEGFATARIKVWYETGSQLVYEGRCFSYQIAGWKGRIVRVKTRQVIFYDRTG